MTKDEIRKIVEAICQAYAEAGKPVKHIKLFTEEGEFDLSPTLKEDMT